MKYFAYGSNMDPERMRRGRIRFSRREHAVLELRLDRPANISEIQEIVTAIEGFCKYFRLEELFNISIARKSRCLRSLSRRNLLNS